MQTTKTQLSEAYFQLAKIIELLEKSHFEIDKDFGINTLETSAWYFSPSSVAFLESRLDPNWANIKYNRWFTWHTESWQGFQSKGVALKLSSD